MDSIVDTHMGEVTTDTLVCTSDEEQACDAMVDAARLGQVDVVEQMIADGSVAGLNRAMRQAAESGHLDVVQLLLDAGADDYAGGAERAAGNGHTHIISLLVDHGDIEHCGWLYQAASGGYTHIVHCMLDKWRATVVDMNELDTALVCAALNGHVAFVEMMLQRGATDYNTAMFSAAINGQFDVVRLLADCGANNFAQIQLVAREYPLIVDLMARKMVNAN